MLVACFSTSGNGDDDDTSLQLTVPEIFYAVEGVATSLNCRNFVQVVPSTPLHVDVDCPVGQLDGEVWHLRAIESNVGDHRMTVRISKELSEPPLSASFIVRIVPAESEREAPVSLLIIGDSLTNASRYPNTITRLLEEHGNLDWTMMGTHHPKSALPEVFHEGYGSWTWERFSTRYAPKAIQSGKSRSSPFVFLSEDGESELDVARYFSEYHGGKAPDFVFILLGINDCFHADPDEPSAIESKIDAMMKQSEIFLESLKRAAPEAIIGIGLTPAPNDREGAFVSNYGKRYTRDGWRRIHHRLVQRQLEAFSGREKLKLYVVPTSHSIDPHLGYPDDNAVHPNDAGYQAIGTNVYAWIMAMLAER